MVESTSTLLESLRGTLKENPHCVASATRAGKELFHVLKRSLRQNVGEASGNGEITDGWEVQSGELYKQANELLVQAVIIILECCGKNEKCKDGMFACDEEEGNAAAILLQATGANNTNDGLTVLYRLWVRARAAYRAWRWCEAHVTLLPGGDPALCCSGLYDLLPVSEWWWRPESGGAMGHSAVTNTAGDDSWTLFEDLFPSKPSACPNSCRKLHEIETTLEFLGELCVSDTLFTHRIAVSCDTLRRLFTGMAVARLQQARLFSYLSFVKEGVTARRVSSGGEPSKDEARLENKKMLWIRREGLSIAFCCLIEAFTAVQVATMQFNASCDELRMHIRLAMFGVEQTTRNEEEVTQSDCGFFLHPSAEPCSNQWHINHGVGLITTNGITEATIILEDKPLLLVEVPSSRKRPEKEEKQDGDVVSAPNTERSSVVGAALELFLRGGLVHRDEATIAHIAKALQTGRLLGDPSAAPATWAALHLLAMITPPKESDTIGSYGVARKDVGLAEGFSRDISDLVHCWENRSIPLEAPQEIRIKQQEVLNTRRRVMCSAISLINHSCKPNAMLSFSFNKDDSCEKGEECIRVIALRDIEPGEEITVSYLPSLLLPKSLKDEQNGFRCRCSFCTTKTALLEGVMCPECRQLIYDEATSEKDSESAQGREGFQLQCHARQGSSCVFGTLPSTKRTRSFQHASDCMRAKCSTYEELSKQTLQGYANALSEARSEFMTDNGSSGANNGTSGHGQCPVGDKPSDPGSERRNLRTRTREVCTDDNFECGRLARRGMRCMMDLDSLACGLPTTHHVRIQTRLECLAISLNANLTPDDSLRLLALCEELLEDLQRILPLNYPLLTGVRLQYAFVRGRHITEITNADHDTQGHGHGCCGGVRENAALMSLPFLKDEVIRECIVRSFQEYYVSFGWQYAARPQEELLLSYLQDYPLELLMCGVESVEHLTLLSLMYDASQECLYGSAGALRDC
uniref:SET domain-containing protein n=1 Tax=Trypanosoma congolense (strain IL3000) TaxID=1068625 RepID=G0UXP1_TRYCI|nr:conserved hypothetical protein [Trypanosoma congolense IL3000]